MMKVLKISAVALIATQVCSGALAQERETILIENDGSTTVVRTDERGTTVDNDGTRVYTSGADRHDDQVGESRNRGGTEPDDFDNFPEFDD